MINLEQLELYIGNELEPFAMRREALEFYQRLDGILQGLVQSGTISDEYLQRFRHSLTQLQWIAFPLLSETETLTLLEQHFVTALEDDSVDLFALIRARMINEMLHRDRDALKQKMRQALIRNHEVITGEKLIIGGKEQMGTVGAWIVDYQRSVGSEKASAVKVMDYLFQSEHAKRTTTAERKKLERLIQTFEILKLSSQTLEGIEELIPIDDSERPGVLRSGIYEPVDPKVREEIKEAQVIIQHSLVSDIENRTAHLRALAAAGNLEKVLDDTEAKIALDDFLRKAQKAMPQDRHSLVVMTLRVLLEQSAGTSNTDATKTAVELGNLMARAGKPEYLDMAYFDEATKTFKWKEE